MVIMLLGGYSMNEIFEIKRFLLENEEIDIESRKFFLAYILNKYRYKNVNQINDYEVDINSLINDLRVLNSFLLSLSVFFKLINA